MSKTFFYRLFRMGRLPRQERERLAAEGLECLVEGIPITIAWRRFRQVGHRIHAHQQNATGAVAITRERLLVYAFSKRVLDIHLSDPTTDRVTIGCPNPDTLSIRLEAGDFNPDACGQITYWLMTAEAATLANLWRRREKADARP